MRIVWLSSLIFFSSSFSIAQLSTTDSLYVQFIGDTTIINDVNITFDCCASWNVTTSLSNDTIIIIQTNTNDNLCRCICNYDISCSLVNLTNGDWNVIVYRQSFITSPKDLVHEFSFTQPSGASQELVISYQAYPCHEPIINTVEETEFPKTFSLLGNYPNPFNPVTIIRYQIHRQSKVKLEIFDDLGRFITTLIDEEKSLGDYEVPWNASGFSSGVYLCKLTTGNETQIRKITLLK